MSTDAPKIPLSEWAKTRYNPPPSDWVLRKWVRRGEIVPLPELVGKKYFVEPGARRIVDPTPVGGGLVRKLQGATP